MLKLRDIVTAGIVAFAILCSAFACTAQQKRDAKTALDIANTFCILAHSTEEPPAIAAVCGIEAVVVPEIERFLSEHRQASARELMSARGPASASASSAPPALPPASASPSASAAPKPAASAVPPAASSAPANDNATAPAKKKRAK
jgi:hypothetical protein